MFKRLKGKVVKKIKEQTGEGLVTTLLVVVMLAIITVGVFTAVKPGIKGAEEKTSTLLQSASSSFTY